jgi:two-component system response regulator YesN
MYGILIIDDEQVVREGISENIDWKGIGFELLGAAKDGREGLEAVSRLEPDVVITDICMPFVDGLELAGAIGEQYPRTKTILLTGYDEFEYAKEAVKLKVYDFLLKPITAAELTEMLQALRRELDGERDQAQKLERLQKQLRASLPVYRERFLNRLVRTDPSDPEVRQTVDLLELDLPGPHYTALICDLDPPETGRRPSGGLLSSSNDEPEEHLSSLALQNILGELAEECSGMISFSTPHEEAVAVISVEQSREGTPRALEAAELISDRVQRELRRTVSIGIGDSCSTLEELSRSYREARTALEHRFVLGANQVITIQQVRGGSERPGSPGESEPRNRYIRAIKGGFSEEALSALTDIVQSLRNSGDDMDHCQVVMHQLLADTITTFDAVGVDYREVPSLGANPFKQLDSIKTLSEMERWFLAFLDGARHLLEGRRQKHSELKAIGAEEYIRHHFKESDLTLQKVCRALAVSKSYLSSVFKAHTGMTLVEYITTVRMEEAKLLLSSGDRKIYEIAEEVGFRDAHYFSLTFKKQTGRSPTEFRELSWGRAAK